MFGSKCFLVVFLTLALAGGADTLSAQQGLGSGGLGLYGLGPRLGENVALALELQAELGLSGEQVQALQELGAGIQTEVAPLEEEIEGLRNQILTGEVAERDGLIRLQSLLSDYDEVAEPYRAGVSSILTLDQHQALQVVMFESRPYPGGGGWGIGAGYAGYGRGIAYGRGGRGAGMGYGARPAYGRGAAVGFRGSMALGARGGVGMGAGRAGLGVGRAGLGAGRGGMGFRRISPRVRWRRW